MEEYMHRRPEANAFLDLPLLYFSETGSVPELEAH